MVDVATHGDAIRVEVSGTESKSVSNIGTVPGVAVLAAAGKNSTGQGIIRSAGLGGKFISYKAPGSNTFGNACECSVDGDYLIEDGEDRDKWLRIQVFVDYLIEGQSTSGLSGGLEWVSDPEQDPDTPYNVPAGQAPSIFDTYYTKEEIDAFFEGEDSGKKQVDWARITSKPDHNDLSGPQGGKASEYYHLEAAEHTELTNWMDNVTLAADGSVDMENHPITNLEYLETQKSKMSIIGGFCVLLTNKTGAPSVKGQQVKADTNNNDSVVLTAVGDVECFGVFLDDGIADGAAAWVVVGGIADVAMEDNTAATRGNWVETGNAEAGYADATGASPAAAPGHFEEIGHCIETVAAGGPGTHILARCILHFL